VEKDVLYRTEVLMLDKQDKVEEQEANCLAAAILMPKELIEVFWRRLGEVESMAKLFGTSFTAMSWRLKNLGLIE
jgi:Zn-dependent peptidase ImmA (M78 family)